jgi:hypothetical protein
MSGLTLRFEVDEDDDKGQTEIEPSLAGGPKRYLFRPRETWKGAPWPDFGNR